MTKNLNIDRHNTEQLQTSIHDAAIKTVKDVDNRYEALFTNKTGRQIDWISIEAEYIHGSLTVDEKTGTRVMYWPSQNELSKKYRLNERSLAERCRTEKWVERRELYKQKIKRRIGQERVNSLMSESARYDAKNLIILDKIYEQLDILLDNQALMGESNSYGDESMPRQYVTSPATTMKNLDMAINVLSKGHTLVRNIMGEPINSEKTVNELMALQQEEEADIAAKAKRNPKQREQKKKHINKLIETAASREELLNSLMQKKRQLEGEMEDLRTEKLV